MPNTPKRIFIVGCPRSGTTLLQSLLAAHPDVISFPESKFFLFLVSVPEERSRRYALGLIAPRLRPGLESFLDEIGQPHLKRNLPILPLIRLYTRSFIDLLDGLTEAAGASVWVEKTPDHLRSLKHIQRYVPDAHIIHIVRNGADVIASLYELVQTQPELWGQYYRRGLDDCARRWLEDIEISRQHLQRPNHSLVCYDDLVRDPLTTLMALCRQIDLKWSDRMLEGYQNASTRLIRGRETWKARVSHAIDTTTHRKFQTLLTPQQQDYVLQRIQHVNLETLKEMDSTV